MPQSRTTTPSKTKRSTSSSKSKATAPLPLVQETDWKPISNAIGYQLGKQVNLPQLQSEISALSSVEVTNTALSGPDDPTQPVSDGNYLALWVSPPGVNAAAVAQAVAAHQPNPDWGIPQLLLDFNALLQALRDNPEVPLSAQDQDTLIRGLALSFSMLTNPPSSS